jgi:hypothetical protein
VKSTHAEKNAPAKAQRRKALPRFQRDFFAPLRLAGEIFLELGFLCFVLATVEFCNACLMKTVPIWTCSA